MREGLDNLEPVYLSHPHLIMSISTVGGIEVDPMTLLDVQVGTTSIADLTGNICFLSRSS